MRKNCEIWKILRGFCHFRCQFETFSFLKNAIHSSLSLLNNQTFPCWPFKTFKFTKSLNDLTKMRKTIEKWKILGFVDFVIFGVNLRHFHLENCNKHFGKAYWTTQFLLIDPFKRSKQESPSEI